MQVETVIMNSHNGQMTRLTYMKSDLDDACFGTCYLSATYISITLLSSRRSVHKPHQTGHVLHT